MIQFRAAEERDAHYLIDIDIKCFDYAWMPEDWRQASKTCVGTVATWYGTPIGMAIFAKTEAGDIEIVKIAVKKPYRNRGVASQLLLNCAIYAREIHIPRMVMLVPEGRLRPGEPDDISTWLTKLGFRAQAPLLRDYFTFYGQAEDGVLFSLPIPLA